MRHLKGAALLVVVLWAAPLQAQTVRDTSANLTSATCPGSGCVDLNVNGLGSAAVQVAGTYSGTLTFKGSVNGAAFNSLGCTSIAAGASAANTTTTTGTFFCPTTGLKALRVEMTTYTSGTASVALSAVTGGGGAAGSVSGGAIAGDASALKQDEQTALLTTIDGDTGALGATGDAAATQGSTGTISAKLRTLTSQLNTLAGYLDGVETKLDTVHTDLATTIDGRVDGLESKLDAIVANQDELLVDPCQGNAKAFAELNGTADITAITGTSAKKIYICALNLISATAQNLNVVSGTGTTCQTGRTAIPGLAGGTTAATGWNFGANGGIALGNGGFAIARVANDADNVCVDTSSTGQFSGGVTYVVQ